jgi:hypothetical protein
VLQRPPAGARYSAVCSAKRALVAERNTHAPLANTCLHGFGTCRRRSGARCLSAQGGGGRAHIKISANGEPFLEAVIRDNEAVSQEQLGGYLSRLVVKGTTKLPIKADAEDAKRAIVRAKFELRLANRGAESRPVFTMTFDELRLHQTKADSGEWFLTMEGIELIEKAIPEKK